MTNMLKMTEKHEPNVSKNLIPPSRLKIALMSIMVGQKNH